MLLLNAEGLAYFIYLLLCFALPNVLWQLLNRKGLQGSDAPKLHILWSRVFMCYCGLAMFLAETGTVWDLVSYGELIGGVSLVPFAFEATVPNILNVVMFLPLGFLLPLIWRGYRKLHRSLLTGLMFSLLIELLQLFNYRITDVDDLIMNSLGTIGGWLIWQLFRRIFPKAGDRATQIAPGEPVIYILLGAAGVFLLYNWRGLSGLLC